MALAHHYRPWRRPKGTAFPDAGGGQQWGSHCDAPDGGVAGAGHGRQRREGWWPRRTREVDAGEKAGWSGGSH
ncbi:hypothetical protein E2562_036600 [Oryza meyeriana var. granulata]|uniref:Uncharacterized protein n=1 Tax=Oryza meyeriana var. granulata TaxID=110450 RepID=A0A6G1DAN2_9ORYZ|nr:hypothetical protein E2562_036600 [Oryza meyeriana var. granulata]